MHIHACVRAYRCVGAPRARPRAFGPFERLREITRRDAYGLQQYQCVCVCVCVCVFLGIYGAYTYAYLFGLPDGTTT